jgi:Bacterial membrane protein YfhO
VRAEARRTALLGGGLGLLLALALLTPCLTGSRVPARGDLTPFFWPMKAYTAARWTSGELPLWNPLSGCGEPWLAQLQTGVLYPGDLPFLLPWPFGPTAGISLHLAVAAAGMAAWLWALGTSRAGALAGAATYAGGGAFLSLIPAYNNACTAAWLPWVFLGARRAVEEGRVITLAVPLALAFLAGEPALALAAGLAAAFVAFASRREGNRTTVSVAPGRAARSLAFGALLAIGLTSAVLAPFGEHVVRSGRAAGVDRAEAMARPVGPGDLADLFLPPSDETTRTASGWRGGYLLSLALGPAVLLLAAGAGAGFPGRGRLLGALALVGAVGFLLSLGAHGLLAPFLHGAGLLRGLRFPARWFVFTHLLVAVLVGAGLDGWLHGEFRSPAARLAARAVLGGTAALLLAALLPGALSAGRDPFRGAVVVSAATLLAALLAWRRYHPARPRWHAAAALLLAAGPLPFVARDPLLTVPASEVRPGLRPLLGLSHGEGENRVFSMVSDAAVLVRTTLGDQGRWTPESPAKGARSLAGYTNLFEEIPSADSASPIPDLRRLRVFGAVLSGGSPQAVFSLANVRSFITPFRIKMPGAQLVRSAGGVQRYDFPSPSGRIFFPRTVRFASDDEVFSALRNPSFAPGDVAFVFTGDAPVSLPAARPALAAARVEVDRPERMEISSESSGSVFVVLTRTFNEGWKGEVDGRPLPLVRTDLAFTGFTIPPGAHRIVLRYLPASFVVGAALSVVSLLITVFLWLNSPPPAEVS